MQKPLLADGDAHQDRGVGEDGGGVVDEEVNNNQLKKTSETPSMFHLLDSACCLQQREMRAT